MLETSKEEQSCRFLRFLGRGRHHGHAVLLEQGRGKDVFVSFSYTVWTTAQPHTAQTSSDASTTLGVQMAEAAFTWEAEDPCTRSEIRRAHVARRNKLWTLG